MKKTKFLNKIAFRLWALLLCLSATVPQAWATTYTVAGSDTQTLGTSWGQATSSNDMTLYSGNWYYLVKSVTYSSSATYEYKITVDHSWNTSYGDNGGNSNASYSVSAGSGYVCYIFNSSTHVPQVVTSFQTIVLAGSDTQALGSSWSGSDTNNSMTTTDGITYTLTKSVDYTTGGTMECKAVIGGSDWYGNSSGNNVSYNIPNAGSYNVTYNFNVITKIVTASVEEISVQPTSYYVKGDDTTVFPNGWNTGDDTKMTDNGDGTYTWTANGVHLDATSYQYKVYGDDDTWYPSGANATFAVDVAGTYNLTITWDGSGDPVATATLVQADVTNDYTFYVLLPNGGTPYLYLWYGSGTALNGTWPGTQMTATEVLADGNTWYKMTGSYSYSTLGAIVDFGNGQAQTNDITNLAPGTYYITWDGTANTDPTVTQTPPSAPVEVSYYVKGNDTAVFPNGWNEGESTKMTKNDDGTYTWTATNLTLTKGGDYQFKVYGDDSSWYPSNDNVTLDVPRNGTYNLSVTFDGSNVAYTLTLVEAASMGTYYIEGSEGLGLTWTPVPTMTMTFDSATGYYSYTVDVATAGTYGFLFADGQGSNSDDWDGFNGSYRIGPQSGDQTIDLGGNWVTTQKAGGDNGAYQVTLGTGTTTIYFDPALMKFMVAGNVPTYNYTFYVLPSDGTQPYLYLWDSSENKLNGDFPGGQMTDTETLADGNTWYKWSQDLTVTVLNAIVSGGSNATQTADITNLDPNTYYIKWNPSTREYELSTTPPTASGDELHLVGLYSQKSRYYDSESNSYNYKYDYYEYKANEGLTFKYDGNTGLYYLNNIVLSNGASFCLSTRLGSSEDDWDNMGTRYGYSGDIYTDNYHSVLSTDINTNMPIGEWSAVDYREFRMSTAGIFNVLASPEEGWVRLIRTDSTSLTPMNVYLEQTSNVTLDETYLTPGSYEYTDGEFWPLCVFNKLVDGSWEGGNRYGVTYVGDTTTIDGKTWWHWTVDCSIGDVFFHRVNKESYFSSTIYRKAGVLWVTWDEENGETVMTDHTRQYFEASAEALPSNATVIEGHYYVYFINTVGWEQVSVNAWGSSSPYTDGYGRDVQTWPGQACEYVGIDPVTGYEVWRYDFGTIDGTTPPTGLLFNDSDPNANNEYKEQTGDFEFVNGGVYDYLGLFDGAYTLNNFIRTATADVRYTISNDLLAVYYDADAQTEIFYKDNLGQTTSEVITGALYAKDLNLYGEKSVMPDASYTDYVYDICASSGAQGGSQIQINRTAYDQSNWIKLVVSPNYDGGNNTPVSANDRPDLSQYVGHILPGNTLHIYLIDNVNPTARVMKIERGDAQSYEPNVYVPYNFNDSIVFNFTHQEWQPKNADGTAAYPLNYRTKPVVTWKYDSEGNVTGGEVTRTLVEEEPYKMYYVAPKPQEIAYITWIVYDNLNEADPNNGGMQPYGTQFVHGEYTPVTPVASFLPTDPGRFYAPKNWDRSVMLSGSQYEDLKYLSDEEVAAFAYGGTGEEFGPYSNGYVQSGGVQVNWSLFGTTNSEGLHVNSANEEWWQIFEPGQAYKIKAIIRYAHDSNGTVVEQPSNGDDSDSGYSRNAPRRAADNGQGGFANMYFTGDHQTAGSKFIIFPIDASRTMTNGGDVGNVTTVEEIATTATVTGVRYYNLMGVESNKPFEGINVVVTIYSDGSRTSHKILK